MKRFATTYAHTFLRSAVSSWIRMLIDFFFLRGILHVFLVCTVRCCVWKLSL